MKKHNLAELVRTPKDLSLRDTGEFILVEYSVSKFWDLEKGKKTECILCLGRTSSYFI
jgi:hypothetical protein